MSLGRMGEFGCITMDPPWAEYGGGGRGAQRHYALLETSEIAKVILRSGLFKPAPSAHLWCWVTDNYLLDGLSLIDQLGFRYIKTFTWVKLKARPILHEDVGRPACEIAREALQIGLGKYGRGSKEHCLFATYGKARVPAPADRDSDVLFAERGKHSSKPDEAFDQWFEPVSPGPRLEMFARSHREGWASWGNQLAGG